MSGVNVKALREPVHETWEREVLPTLSEYTTIPCLSPAFDAHWSEAGHLERAARLLSEWCAGRPVAGLTSQIVTEGGRTPVLLVEAPAVGGAEGTVLVYGHLDKQPPLGAWGEGLGPYSPVRRDHRLYGRGTADDGYSVFAALTAIGVLDPATPRPRGVVLIEASEESGSSDLGTYLDSLGPRIGAVDLVICLDSGCLSYDRVWLTSSLRGVVSGTLRVDVLREGVHSGLSGGLVPSSFRVLRQLLSRVEDESSGAMLLGALYAEIPEPHLANLAAVAAEYPGVGHDLPVVEGLRLMGRDDTDRLVAKSWRPSLAVTGMDGIPALADAGNVLRAFSAARISVRLPPSVDAAAAARALHDVLAADPPSGARVTVELGEVASGWVAPDPAPWVAEALDAASRACFDKPWASYSEGGTIPFLATLARRYPGTQMVATGVLGPESNAHGPNEFLHLPMAEAVTVTVASLLVAAGQRPRLTPPAA